jgi:beta-lactamase superfamily II metal-dependent hydrolase
MVGMKRNVLLPVLMLAAIIFITGGPVRQGSSASSAEAVKTSSAPGRLQVYVLDVGCGQSVLVVSPTGKAALIDAGSADAGSRVIGALRRRGVRNLEVAVATQAGADYIGGLRRVAASSDIVIKSFIDSAQPWKTETYQQMLAAVQSAGIPVTAARRGQLFDLGGGARLDIINPVGDGTWLEPPAGETRENANSVVVRLLYREFVMLVMSGAGAATAAQMIEARQNIWAPFLLVGQGGSRDSMSEKMLSIVQPKFAIISTAAGSEPAQETLERLRAVKAEIYRTDTGGEISITSDGRKHEIAKER